MSRNRRLLNHTGFLTKGTRPPNYGSFALSEVTFPSHRRRARSQVRSLLLMVKIPLLIPCLPTADQVLPWLRRIDEARWYTNFGPPVREFEH